MKRTTPTPRHGPYGSCDSSRALRRLGLLLLVLSVPAAGPLPADAQEIATPPQEPPQTRERGPWWTLWSRKTPHDRLIVGMITSHVWGGDKVPTNNWGVGAIYDGFVGATFITTHGPRGWVAAFERSWFEGTMGPAQTMLGFRTGLVYGYDGRLFQLAEWTPILPYGQPVFLMRAGPVTLDLTYTWIVVSLTAGISLW